MLAIRLPEEIEARLEALAKATGRTKTFYAREAIVEYIDDLEDIYLAEKRLEDLRAGRSRTYTLEEVELSLACWRIEFEDGAKKELARLDRRAQKNIWRFLSERIATEEDPRRFGDPLRRDLSGLWKFRVGDFRIVAEIREEEVLVLVIRVGRRSKVYGGP